MKRRAFLLGLLGLGGATVAASESKDPEGWQKVPFEIQSGRRVYYIDVPPSKAEKYMEHLRAHFAKMKK